MNTEKEIKKRFYKMMLKLLKSQQQQCGMFYFPQIGFQNKISMFFNQPSINIPYKSK